MGPGDLKQVLEGLCLPVSDDLLVGSDTADDAGVLRLDSERALILTVDFFTPIVDDPYTFGAVAAANSFSDVYAMGGRPLAALNICGFPPGEDKSLLRRILQGGADKAKEAGAVIAGGHTVRDEDLKYGLAVVGVVHPDRVITNAAARPGDKLVLTKPLGTGLLSTARKKDKIKEKDFEPAVQVMLELNRAASEVMVRQGVKAATDITGFGLLGHAAQMACASGAALKIFYRRVPLIEGALFCAEQGWVPGGTKNNREHFGPLVEGEIPEPYPAVLFDPQTSGGLLICATAELLPALLKELEGKGVKAAVVGEVLEGPPGKVLVE